VIAQTLRNLITQLAKMEILALKMIHVGPETVLVAHLIVAIVQRPIHAVYVSKTVEMMLR